MLIIEALAIVGYLALFVCGIAVLGMGFLFIVLVMTTVATYIQGSGEDLDELDIMELEPFRCRLDDLEPCQYQGCPWGVDFRDCPELVEMDPEELRRETHHVRDS